MKMTRAGVVRDAKAEGAVFYHTATLDCYIVVFRPKKRRRWLLFGRAIRVGWERQVYMRDLSFFGDVRIWYVLEPWHRLARGALDFVITDAYADIDLHPASGVEHR